MFPSWIDSSKISSHSSGVTIKAINEGEENVERNVEQIFVDYDEFVENSESNTPPKSNGIKEEEFRIKEGFLNVCK